MTERIDRNQSAVCNGSFTRHTSSTGPADSASQNTQPHLYRIRRNETKEQETSQTWLWTVHSTPVVRQNLRKPDICHDDLKYRNDLCWFSFEMFDCIVTRAQSADPFLSKEDCFVFYDKSTRHALVTGSSPSIDHLSKPMSRWPSLVCLNGYVNIGAAYLASMFSLVLRVSFVCC